MDALLTSNNSAMGSMKSFKSGFGTGGGPIKADRIIIKPSNITFNKKSWKIEKNSTEFMNEYCS